MMDISFFNPMVDMLSDVIPFLDTVVILFFLFKVVVF